MIYGPHIVKQGEDFDAVLTDEGEGTTIIFDIDAATEIRARYVGSDGQTVLHETTVEKENDYYAIKLPNEKTKDATPDIYDLEFMYKVGDKIYKPQIKKFIKIVKSDFSY